MIRGPQIEGVPWHDERRGERDGTNTITRGFASRFTEMFNPGDHLSAIAPTGAGKTTFVGGLSSMRRYFLGLDPKGGDDTLGALDLRRLPTWPGSRRMEKLLDDDEREGRPSRYVVGPLVETSADLPKLRQACADALDGAFDMGGWTVYADELQILCDPRMFNLRGKVAKLLVAARSKGVTFISSFQAPSWVPSEAIRQPTWIAAAYTRDTDTVNRMAEILGRPKAEIRGAMGELEKFHWMVVGRDPRAPILVTMPPKLVKKRTAAAAR